VRFWNLISRKRPDGVEALRARFARFRHLLEMNNRVLGLIADANEKLGGEYLFDARYLQSLEADLGDAVTAAVRDLAEISGNRYPRLMWALERARAAVRASLEPHRVTRDMPLTLKMEELVTKQAAIMDKHDAEKRIGMIVDEWGTWYNVEPGTNPGFLYQQNSLRDALVAGLTLNIFNQHCDRVKMANIAQTINVLQAMILTSKEKMLRTPTYWVFEMFKVHQGGTYLPVELMSPDYVFGQQKIPMVSASATRAADKSAVHVSLVNASPAQAVTVSVKLAGVSPTAVTGRVLTATTINAHNTFDAPDALKPAAFSGASLKGGTLEVRLPAKAVVVLTLK